MASHSTSALSPSKQELKVWYKGMHDRQFLSANAFPTSARDCYLSFYLLSWSSYGESYYAIVSAWVFYGGMCSQCPLSFLDPEIIVWKL